MTDQINDQISAFIDNELSADESALLVRRFERDTESRARAMRYTLIGASLRGELLEPHPSVLRQRVAAALSGATPAAPRARGERFGERFAKPLLSVAIAATVAVVAVGALRSMNETPLAPSVAPAVVNTSAPSLDQSTLQARDAAASYVVPPRTNDQSSTVAPIRLTNYLMHHGEFASGLTRTSVNSNVVGAAMEPLITDTAVAKPVVVESEGLR